MTRQYKREVIERMDIMQLLNALDYQTQRLATIEQAAIDYIHLREKVRPIKKTDSMLQEHLDLAYRNLKDLII